MDGELSLGTVGRALWRRKRAIVIPTLLVAVASFFGVNAITPRYKSEARVLVESRENIFLRPEAEKTMIDRGSVDPETVTSQVQVVLSRDLARSVISELKLDSNPEFNAALREVSPLAILGKIGIIKDPMSMSLEERVLAAYYDRLNAFSVDKSRVIVIEFQSADPELAAKAANLIAEKYLTFQQMAKQDQARLAGRWLSGELEKLRNKVSESEAKVEEFRGKSNLFVGSNNASLSNQQLTDLNSQVAAARAQKADAEARARLIRDALNTGQSLESSDIANSELIRRLSEQRVTLRAQLAEQSSTLLPQHPRIKELRAQIGDLDQQIRAEGERLARSLENEAKVAGARLEALNASLDALKRQTSSTSEQDVQLRGLEREAKAQRDLLESYLAKYREATARDSIAAAPADARIISQAVVSNVPYFPKKVPIVLIATLGTLAMSTAFVVTGTLVSAAAGAFPLPLPQPSPVPAAPVAPVARRSPFSRTRSTDHVPDVASPPPPLRPAAAPRAEAPVSFAELTGALRQGRSRQIAVIGCSREVGTTTASIGLARSLARGARVVLVDLALSSPNIDVISDEPNAPGLAELMRGEAAFGDIITRDRFSRLHLVATGMLGDPRELIASPMLSDAVNALAQSYDFVVIDGGSTVDIQLPSIATMASRVVLFGGAKPPADLDEMADRMRSAGFAEVSVLAGPPPALDQTAEQPTAA